MTDEELLEWAAKAAGIKALRCPTNVLRDCTGFAPTMNIFSAPVWNPLAYDGDAFRLAVKLCISFDVELGGDAATWAYYDDKVLFEVHGDPYASTRRVIVRAAAEIGKQGENK